MPDTISPGDRVSWRVAFENRRYGLVVGTHSDVAMVREDHRRRLRILHTGILTKECQ